MATDLLASPYPFAAPAGRALLDLLVREIWRERDIVLLVQNTALNPGRIDWDGAAEHVWRSVLSHAVGQSREHAQRLLDEAGQFRPTLQPRIAELLADTIEVTANGAPTPNAGVEPVSIEGLERILETSTLVDASWLDAGRVASRAVGRLAVGGGGRRWIGTGFLVGPRHVLTNAHVASVAAETITFELDYEAGSSRTAGDGSSWEADVQATVRSNAPQHFDWAIVKLTAAPPPTYPRLGIRTPVAPQRGDFASIVQHPQGGPKKLGIFRNVIVSIEQLDGQPCYVRYLTDTDAGSSGSPVFDRDWNVIALHYRWVELPTPVQGLRYANQGLLLSRILREIEPHLASP